DDGHPEEEEHSHQEQHGDDILHEGELYGGDPPSPHRDGAIGAARRRGLTPRTASARVAPGRPGRGAARRRAWPPGPAAYGRGSPAGPGTARRPPRRSRAPRPPRRRGWTGPRG